MKSIIASVLVILIAMRGYSAVGPTVTSFSPAAAYTGTTITINGTGLSATTGVTFGGVAAASFTVVSATKITAVVAAGSSGSVAVLGSWGTVGQAGFIFSALSDIYTDFNGYWASSTALPNSIIPNNSYNLLGFKLNGVVYSTGVNNSMLDSKGVTYANSIFKALPVAGIAGTTPSTTTSNYIALAKNVDGSATVANPTTVSSYTIQSVMTDGVNGLNLGTGVTNLPTSAILKFKISSIDPTKINDAEPDLLITQIAQPVSGNDLFSFIDANGNVIGSTLSHDMTLDAAFGTYDLDLFNLKPSTSFNFASVYSAAITATNREIRIVALKLSDFNITSANVGQISSLQITPSGNSDYAFIAYNARSINLPPNVSTDDAATNTTICSGGTAKLSVIGASAAGGILSYSWQKSTNGGTTWNPLTDGSGIAGSATANLSVISPSNNDKFQATIAEAGNANNATSAVFTITVANATAPSAVSVSSTATSTCLNAPVTITSSVTGGSNLYYQWQVSNGITYNNIEGANLSAYTPPVNTTGSNSYNVLVNSGSGCPGIAAPTAINISVTGIASVSSAELCNSGIATLTATPTSGTVSWYTADAGGSSVWTGNSLITSSLLSNTTYYVASSGCPSALRVPVTAAVDPLSVGGSISIDTTVFANNNVVPLSLIGNTGTVLKWQASTDNFITNVTDLVSTAPTYTAVNLTQTTKFRALVQSGVCTIANSNIATVTVVPGVLPIAGIIVDGFTEANTAVIKWTALQEINMDLYTVERRTDTGFTALYSVQAKNIASGASYSWIDNDPLTGDNFYRIVAVGRDAQQQYSRTVDVAINTLHSGISIYPNPVTNGQLSLAFAGVPTGNYTIQVYNTAGTKVMEKSHAVSARNENFMLVFPSALSDGAYQLTIAGPDRKKQSFTIIKINGSK